MELLKAQIAYLNSRNRLNLYRGGIGAGKTFINLLKAITRCSVGRSALYVMPTYGMINDVVWDTVDELQDKIGFSYTAKKGIHPEIKIGKGLIRFRSGDKPNSLRGGNYHDLYMDEASYSKNDEAYKVGIGRIRKCEDATINIAGSPNGRDWVYALGKRQNSFVVTQSTIDNYFLPESYIDDLLQSYTGDFLRQELYGEIVDFSTGIYLIDKVNLIDRPLLNGNKCRSWDLGFTQNKTSDYTAGALLCFNGDTLAINNMIRKRFEFPVIRELIINTAQKDGRDVSILVESNGTQMAMIQDLRNDERLSGYNIIGVAPQHGKVRRHMPTASLMSNGKVSILRGEWNEDLLDEWAGFSFNDSHEHDDQIDAIQQGYDNLLKGIFRSPARDSAYIL